MSGLDEVNKMRAAGFDDAEIGAWVAGEREKMSAAGFDEVEIDKYFGADRKVPESPGFFKRLAAGSGAVATAAWEGAKQGFGPNSFGFETGSEADKWFKANGLFSEDGFGTGGPIKLVNEALLKPTAALGDLAVKSFAALAGAVEGGSFETVKQMAMAAGESEGMANRAGRDAVAFLTSTMVATGVPVTRLKRLPTGETRVETIGRYPTPEDFDVAAAVMSDGRPNPALRAKLEDLWVRDGLHPSEVVNDAAEDIIAYQKLVTEPPNAPPPAGAAPAAAGGGSAIPPNAPPPAGGAASAAGGGSAVDRVLAKVKVGGETLNEPTTFNKLYAQFIDDLAPINKAVRDAGMKGKLPVSDDPYLLARMTRGTFGKADHFLEYGTYDFKTYKPTGQSLREVLKPAENDLQGLRAYAVSKRAEELRARGVEPGIDAADAAAVVAAGKKYEPVLKNLVAYQNELTRYLKDAGILSDEAYRAMLDANKNYVPFFRVMDDGAGGGGLGTGNRGGIRDPIKSIKGSERDIVDPIESVIKNTYMYVSLAERNNSLRAFVEMAEKSANPNALMKKVKTPIRGTTVTDEEMTKFLQAHGIQNAPNDLLTVFRAARRPLAEDEVAVFRNGKREVYQVDPEVANAFKAVDAESANLLVRILAVPAKLLRAGSVLSPEFIARNLIRDQSSAFVLSKGGYIPMLDLVRGVTSLAKKDDAFQAWMRSGGANSALVSVDRRYIQAKLLDLNKDTGVLEKTWNVVKSPVEILRVVSETVENATRLGEFKRVAKGAASKEDILRGGYSAREVTLDFGRVGAKMRAANMLTAFLNTRVQGLDRVIREFGDHPVRASAKVGVSITLPSVLLWAVNHDDPRYKEIPQWKKDLFWIILTKDNVYAIPKAHEMALVFGTLPERLLDAWVKDDPKAAKEFASTLINSVVPDVTPTFAAPIIEQFSNRSLFTGNPIVPRGLEGQLPEYQYTPYTTELGKKIGSLFAAFPGMRDASTSSSSSFGPLARSLTTPVLIENYVRAWSGGLGTYALKVTDGALRKAGVLPDPVMPAATLADVPLVRAFVVRYPSATAQSIQDFYENFEKKEKVFNSIMARAQEGDAKAVEDLRGYDESAMALPRGIKDALTEHSQLIRNIHKAPDMTRDEKRQLVDTLYFQMIELAKGGNELLREAEKATKKP